MTVLSSPDGVHIHMAETSIQINLKSGTFGVENTGNKTHCLIGFRILSMQVLSRYRSGEFLTFAIMNKIASQILQFTVCFNYVWKNNHL